jgi:hypothetical protein
VVSNVGDAHLVRYKFKSRRFDIELIKLLKGNKKTFNSSDILDALGINSRDIQAAKLIKNQLESLLRFGLVTENPSGWRWVREQ